MPFTFVTPHAGVWVEIFLTLRIYIDRLVTPHAGVWVEIVRVLLLLCCGVIVTPHAGVWVEILRLMKVFRSLTVTPHAGVWVEIMAFPTLHFQETSLPTRECELKCFQRNNSVIGAGHSPRGSVSWNARNSAFFQLIPVTPHAGVWVEM